MKRITSISNPRIKEAAGISRGKGKRFWIVEGKRLFREALDSGIRFETVLVTEESLRTEARTLSALENAGTEILSVTPAILDRISDVEKSQGLLGIARRMTAPAAEKPERFAGLLHSLRDPGNFGTLIRTAEATGCEFLAYSADCADPFQPKVVRASMGSIFRVPLRKIAQISNYLEEMRISGVHLYALSPHTGMPLDSFQPEFPALVIVGSETGNLPVDLTVVPSISIPMTGKVESLNAGIAAAICFYHLRHFALQSNL